MRFRVASRLVRGAVLFRGRHPDFSADGGILGFGYYRIVTYDEVGQSALEVMDNFSVTATPVR